VVAAVTAAAVPVPANIFAGTQPLNGVLEIGFRAASGPDQCDASGRVRNPRAGIEQQGGAADA
jgi:hypothetical protein